MRIVAQVAAMQKLGRRWKRQGVRVGFVPTMGYLHAGHLSLVREARKRVGKNGKVVVSIYVNPTQFAPSGRFLQISARLEARFEIVPRSGRGCRVHAERRGNVSGRVIAPRWPDGAARRPYQISAPTSSRKNCRTSMEGASRPTHFRGVTTVVAKLFNLVLPDVAVFGQKDFQQAAIIKRMVADLNFPVKIIVAPTVRETDGLAMSSRNKYLDRRFAPAGGRALVRDSNGARRREQIEDGSRGEIEGCREKAGGMRTGREVGLRGIFRAGHACRRSQRRSAARRWRWRFLSAKRG